MRAVLGALALVLSSSAAFGAEDGLRVQARWNVVGVAVSTSRVSVSPRVARRALDGAARTVARELPGVAWRVASRVREAAYEDDGSGIVSALGPPLRRAVERLAARDDELATADVVFVYAPLHGEDWFGMALQRARPAGRRPVWYAVVNVSAGEVVARKARASLGERSPVPARLVDAAARLVEVPPLREVELRATTVHEFGHFLAPGTRDVRAVDRLRGWLRNGADEPELHDPGCVMWTASPSSIVAKLRAFPRVIAFCDRCRGRVGATPRMRVRRWLALD